MREPACETCGHGYAEGTRDRILDAVRVARDVQEFLWGRHEEPALDLKHWCSMLEKRIRRLRQVDMSNPHAIVEIRKRALQTAAIAVAWLERLDALPPTEFKPGMPSCYDMAEGPTPCSREQ